MSVLSAREIRSSCRQLDAVRHPLLGRLSRDDIYDGGFGMAPGGLLLAEMLAERLSLEPGDSVLDVGCGRGQSSVLLASRYRVQVTSVDLWIGSEERRRKAESAGVNALIRPLHGDIGRGVPVAPGSLKAIFCMQSFHSFGTRGWLLRYLASLLEPGGKLGIAQGCFREELDVLPPLFTDTDGWNAEYRNYHSASWWLEHFAASGDFSAVSGSEVMDGDIMWEDDVLYRCELHGWSPEYLARSSWLIRQVLHGRTARPSLTHCMVVATKH